MLKPAIKLSAARAVANWAPAPARAFANAVVIAGSTVGMVFTPPLISWLMVARGWRETFFVTAALGFLIALLWRWYATDQPAEHKRINDAELIAIYTDKGAGRPEAAETPQAPWRTLLGNLNLLMKLLRGDHYAETIARADFASEPLHLARLRSITARAGDSLRTPD